MADEARTNNAHAFMETVRRAQSETNISMRGRPGLKDVQRFAIRAAAISCVSVALPLRTNLEARIRLLERFEEMCRKNRIDVPEGMRPAILERLLTELWTNASTLKADVSNLISVTAYCGAVGPKLRTEFPGYSDMPGLLRQVVKEHATDPLGFLRVAQNNVNALASHEDFAVFRKTPYLFIHAVLTNPRDPFGFLREVQENIKALASDEEFAAFRETPYIFTRAAVTNPRAPHLYLREVQKNINALASDEEFVSFRKTPYMFKRAAVDHPDDPHGFLRAKIKSTGHAQQEKNRRLSPKSQEPTK